MTTDATAVRPLGDVIKELEAWYGDPVERVAHVYVVPRRKGLVLITDQGSVWTVRLWDNLLPRPERVDPSTL